MAHRQIEVDEFLRLAVDFPVLDVRSPSEYHYAHIPGAFHFPLFTDEERAVVGTLYKQTSRRAAIRKGLDFFGPKLNLYIEEAEKIIDRKNIASGHQDGREICVLVHCWRGGMRSAAIAWLLDVYGYTVMTLRGGYKEYRKWVLNQFEIERDIRCLGGYTGSGKTDILYCLQRVGCRVIDLENLARHKGSAFGAIGQSIPQPSQEMFENLLARELNNVTSDIDLANRNVIWLEDESQRIGTVNIPEGFWRQMKSNELVFIDIPFEQRLDYIIQGYGKLDRSQLLAAISRLQKKMGGLETKNAIGYLLDGDIHACFHILLKYYDKQYLKALDKKREGMKKLDVVVFDDVSPNVIAGKIFEMYGRE